MHYLYSVNNTNTAKQRDVGYVRHHLKHRLYNLRKIFRSVPKMVNSARVVGLRRVELVESSTY